MKNQTKLKKQICSSFLFNYINILWYISYFITLKHLFHIEPINVRICCFGIEFHAATIARFNPSEFLLLLFFWVEFPISLNLQSFPTGIRSELCDGHSKF